MAKKTAAEPVMERSSKVKTVKKSNGTAKKPKVSKELISENHEGPVSIKSAGAPTAIPPTPINGKLNLKKSLQDFFGFDKFKGEQEVVIESVMNGYDTFVIMPTGGGKSLCYQLPALISEGTAIIISPLIALMKNQVDAIRGYSSKDNVAHFLNSSLTKAQQK